MSKRLLFARAVIAAGVGLTCVHCDGSPDPGTSDASANANLGSPNTPGSGADAGAPSAADASATADAGTTPAGPDAAPPTVHQDPPDFGPNVLVFDPSMAPADVQSKLDQIYSQQDSAQFGDGRYAYFFKAGTYDADVKIGFYVEALGLGASPDDVTIRGAVRAKADWLGSNNATCNFWRGAENLAVEPSASIDNDVNRWAVSQGTQLRRVHVRGDLALDDGGWSSGGFIADSVIDGTISSGTQQQFLTRNDDQNWTGSNWNMVFVGDGNAPSASWPAPPYTVTSKTPRVREKPYLWLDAVDNYEVMVPALKTSSQGHSWGSAAAPGTSLAIDSFYVAKPADTSATINAALGQGKNLLFTPGVYHLGAALEITRPGTVVLGLGLATLVADSGSAILSVADVDDVTLAGLLLEAGPTSSATLLEVGPKGSSVDHSAKPTALFDVHCRVGGANAGTAASCVTINSRDVMVDNMWLWRADHGAGASWTGNRSANGLVVNGDDVTIYGLFSEHFQEYQTLWNGNGGAVYFYQSEMPYDPPNQGAWQASPGHDGWPSYKVADSVTSHHAEGIGVYSVFTNDVSAENAIEAPSGAGIVMQHMMTVSLASGTIAHIVNDTGAAVGSGTMTAYSSQ